MLRLGKLKEQLGNNRQFRYTTDQGCLTLKQRQFYEENGYIIARNFLKDKDMEAWRTRFLDYCDLKLLPTPGMQIVKDISLVKKNKGKELKGQASITKIQDFQFDQILQSYCTNADLIPYLKSFCGENIKSVHTMFINKPPNMGFSSRHPMHQDLVYFPFGPEDKIVAVWSSLEDATIQNGSLEIIPKSHKGQLLQHQYPNDGEVNKAYFGIQNNTNILKEKVNLQMKKGDVVFFHPLLIHGSGPNTSQNYRKSMCCHFAASECKYFDVKGTIQQSISKEVMSYLGKKFPGIPEYNSYWKMKSQLIIGKEYEDAL